MNIREWGTWLLKNLLSTWTCAYVIGTLFSLTASALIKHGLPCNPESSSSLITIKQYHSSSSSAVVSSSGSSMMDWREMAALCAATSESYSWWKTTWRYSSFLILGSMVWVLQTLADMIGSIQDASFTVLHQFYEDMVVQFVRNVYLYGPTSLGFWQGLPEAEICATYTGLAASKWQVMDTECADMIRAHTYGLIVGLQLVAVMGIAVMLLCKHDTAYRSAVALENKQPSSSRSLLSSSPRLSSSSSLGPSTTPAVVIEHHQQKKKTNCCQSVSSWITGTCSWMVQTVKNKIKGK
jgi:hypothetical protein